MNTTTNITDNHQADHHHEQASCIRLHLEHSERRVMDFGVDTLSKIFGCRFRYCHHDDLHSLVLYPGLRLQDRAD